jgi:osmotically-inducible protein OsmY
MPNGPVRHIQEKNTMKCTIFGILCTAALISGPVAGRALASQATTTAKTGSGALEDRIEQRIHADSSLKRHDVKVAVNDGVVTLTGTVETAAQRDRAGRLAKVTGITRVDNQIVVDKSARGTSGALDRAAEKTKEGTGKAIDKTREGADKAIDKSKAGIDKSKEGVATGADKSASGVRKAGSELADAFVLASVKTRLFGEAVLKGSDINVDSDKHVVTLKGTVPNEAAHARALEIAQKTDGVDRVVDRLTIGPKK